MTDKWKFKIKTGLAWGIFMAIVMTALEALEKHTFGVYISWKFLVMLLIFSTCGIFILGHFNWKARQKQITDKR